MLTLALADGCDHLNRDRCDHHNCQWPEIQWVEGGGTHRVFRELDQMSPNIFQFQFFAEQLCFRESQHRIPIGLDPLLVRRTARAILTMDADEWHYRFNEDMYEAERRLKAG